MEIGLALHDYHDANGHLPPAVVYGKDHKPLYSWRVLLLPFLQEGQLARQFKLDEPWDSPHNKKLLGEIPRCYRQILGEPDAPGQTHYQVLVGPGTAFERDGLTLLDFPDGTADTIVVVEAAESVPWTKPADLAYDPVKPLPALGVGFGKPVHFLCYEVNWRPGFTACFADGSRRFIYSSTEEKTIRSLITRNGGEKINWSKLD